MTNTSVTLQETGIADAIDGGGTYDSARTKMLALDYATQRRSSSPRWRRRASGSPSTA